MDKIDKIGNSGNFSVKYDDDVSSEKRNILLIAGVVLVAVLILGGGIFVIKSLFKWNNSSDIGTQVHNSYSQALKSGDLENCNKINNIPAKIACQTQMIISKNDSPLCKTLDKNINASYASHLTGEIILLDSVDFCLLTFSEKKIVDTCGEIESERGKQFCTQQLNFLQNRTVQYES